MVGKTMNVEIFTLCDAATVSAGKLNLLGSFDTIAAVSLPCQHPLCAIAIRIRFDLGEEGDHSFEVHFCDPDMRPVMKPMLQRVAVQIPNERSQTATHIWNLFGFELKGAGEYYFELKVDGETQSRLPLYVLQAEPPQT
jgi:hypothetical protein